MKTSENIYIARNIRTGEEVKGTAKEVAKTLKCIDSTVRKYALMPEDSRPPYQKMWEIKRYTEIKNIYRCNDLTEEDCIWWDRERIGVREMLKNLSRKSQKMR